MTEEYYYVTRYALTGGVRMYRKDACEVDGRYLRVPGEYFHRDLYSGNDWCDSREAAEKRIAEMKERRRKSLEKSIKALEKPVKWIVKERSE